MSACMHATQPAAEATRCRMAAIPATPPAAAGAGLSARFWLSLQGYFEGFGSFEESLAAKMAVSLPTPTTHIPRVPVGCGTGRAPSRLGNALCNISCRLVWHSFGYHSWYMGLGPGRGVCAYGATNTMWGSGSCHRVSTIGIVSLEIPHIHPYLLSLGGLRGRTVQSSWSASMPLCCVVRQPPENALWPTVFGFRERGKSDRPTILNDLVRVLGSSSSLQGR